MISAFSPACKLTTISCKLPGPARQGTVTLDDKDGGTDVGVSAGDGGRGVEVALGTGIVGVGVGSARPGIPQEITSRRTATARPRACLVGLL
jgi:hypothetical protein